MFDLRRASDIKCFRVSPLAVVVHPKFRIIHDLTFSAHQTPHTSVNADTDFFRALTYERGGVLRKVLMRILFLRQKFGPSARIVISKLHVKEAFRQVLVDPSRAAYFGYTFGDMAVVELCLEYGWRSSPGFWGLLASAVEHSHNHTSFFTHAVTDIGRRDAQPIQMAPHREGRVAQLPPDCKTVQGLGGGVGDPFFMCIYVDDSILVEVQYFLSLIHI